jgi:PKD repeat protein
MNKLFCYMMLPLLLFSVAGNSQDKSTVIRKICKGSSLDLHGPNSPGVEWFKDGILFSKSKDINVNEEGTYTVVAINEHGCASDASDAVVVDMWATPTPPVVREVQKDCSTSIIKLTAQSFIEDNQSIIYEWYVKGEASPFATGSSIDFETKKNITLTVRAIAQGGGCSSSLTEKDIAALTPYGDFAADKQIIAFGNAVNFTASVTNAVRYEWDFGDGFKSTSENPTHYYNKSGSMTVSLKAYSAEGCLLEINKPGYINVLPEVGQIISIIPPVEVIETTNPFVFKVYPNPVANYMYIDVYSSTAQKATIEYFSMDGKIINKYQETLIAGNNTISAKFITLLTANSNYIIRVTLNNKVEVFQIFKANN